MPLVMDDARKTEASSARRDRRLKNSSPYARPAKKVQKTSSWGGLGGIIKSLFGRPSQDEDDGAMDESQDEQQEAPQQFIPPPPSKSAAYSLSQRGHQISTQLMTNGAATEHEGPRFSRPTDSAQPIKLPDISPTSSIFSDVADNDLEKVTAFIREKKGQPMSEIETEGIIAILSKSTTPKESTFRFSTSPASTAGRGNSPFSAASSAGANGESTTPRKPLTRNPNGSYRWEGGGSAKSRSRNRYHSPSFGASRSTSEHLVLKDIGGPAEPPKRDNSKRRRVGEDAQAPSAVPSGPSIFSLKTPPPAKNVPRSPGPAPSPTRAALAQTLSIPTPGPSHLTSSPPKNGVSSSSSAPGLSVSTARTPKKPSFPSVPSPLRQTWNGDESSSDGSSPRQPTKAASMMEELIKEVTPAPRKMEIVNPYQSAVPGGKPMARPKRQRATAKPSRPERDAAEKRKTEKGKEKQKETEKPELPQAAIELTMPKGSKRSRPPTHISPPPQPASEAPIIEEPSDEDIEPAAKRQKGATNGDIDITEVDEDVPVPSSPKPAAAQLPAKRPSAFGNVKQKVTSAPKEPSKLRFSYQPEGTAATSDAPFGNGSSSDAFMSDVPKADSPKSGSFSFGGQGKPTLAGFGFPSTRGDTAKAPVSAFGKTASAPASEGLPKTTSTFSFGQPAAESKPSAPSFSFGKAASGAGTFSFTQSETAKAPEAPKAEAQKPEAPKADVSMAEAPRPASVDVEDAKAAARTTFVDDLPKYTFPKLSLTTSSGADSNLCAEVKAIKRDALPTFDFSASAVEASVASTSTLKAPEVEKATASRGFDWSAAGVAKPAAPAGWTCGVCMVPNKAEAAKCAACEEPNPAGAPSSSTKPSGGFNWGAAGLKKPEVQGWTCSTCMVPNKGEAAKCAACEEPRP
ncbi:hypothetical protein BD626DRAFT_628494 [Schizophyllum amplum]|uniref:RanBP2-type domain-containing protein n=1 Tax=Schizophyllum amplum TaxID=97359 RepID=A0A550CKI9_9AGAR|nr:hypothetical protein BD626DRAFT_628494 [Auriculariopsis ampla]